METPPPVSCLHSRWTDAPLSGVLSSCVDNLLTIVNHPALTGAIFITASSQGDGAAPRFDPAAFDAAAPCRASLARQNSKRWRRTAQRTAGGAQIGLGGPPHDGEASVAPPGVGQEGRRPSERRRPSARGWS